MKPLECCTDAFPINTCSTILNAWQISGIFSAVDFTARFLNVQTGHIAYASGTTGLLGELLIDLTALPTGFFTPAYTYQLTVFIDNTRHQMLIGGVDHECIEFCVEDGITNTEILPLFQDIPLTAAMLFKGNEGVIPEELTGGKVIRWNSFGSFGIDALQPNSADRPTKGVNKLAFDGSNILCANGASLDFSGSYLQLLVRFKLTNNTAPVKQFQTITSMYDGLTPALQAFALYIDAIEDTIFFDILDNTSGFKQKSREVTNVPLLNQDVIVNCVFDSGTSNIYVNSIQRDKETFSDAEIPLVLDTNTPFNIGGNSRNPPAFEFAFAGDIFGVLAWNQKPSAAEWVYYYNLLKSI